MATVTLTKENFDEVVSGNELVLIDFWAEWCGPCRQFGPIFERVSAEHPDIVFAKIDTEAEPELAAAFEISSIPTLMVIREQVLLHRQAGALPQPALNELVGAARAVDMDDVRSKLAAQ